MHWIESDVKGRFFIQSGTPGHVKLAFLNGELNRFSSYRRLNELDTLFCLGCNGAATATIAMNRATLHHFAKHQQLTAPIGKGGRGHWTEN